MTSVSHVRGVIKIKPYNRLNVLTLVLVTGHCPRIGHEGNKEGGHFLYDF